MSYMDWKDKTKEFKKMDVRGIQGNFFPGLKKQASGMNVGDGFEVIQSFDPIPLYEVMEGLGFEHHTESFHPHPISPRMQGGNSCCHSGKPCDWPKC